MGYNPSVTTSAKSSSVIKANMAVRDIKAYSNMVTYIDIILADIPKGERNQNSKNY